MKKLSPKMKLKLRHPKRTLAKKPRKIKKPSKLTLQSLESKKFTKKKSLMARMAQKKLKSLKKTLSKTLKTTYRCHFSWCGTFLKRKVSSKMKRWLAKRFSFSWRSTLY